MIALFPTREILLAIGTFEVRWYGVLYIAGFVLAWYLLPRLQKYRGLNLSKDDWMYLMAWAIGGVVIGGRLGYVLLWEPTYFLANPTEVLAIWDGGMASHGGFVGVGLALWLAARKMNINLWKLLDVIVVPVAMGLALGRLGNFINQELFNPSVLALLAVTKNILVAGGAYWVLRTKKTVGYPLAAFLLSYGVLRFGIEFIRVQEIVGYAGLTRGQLYTLPILVGGGLLLICRVVKIRLLCPAKR